MIDLDPGALRTLAQRLDEYAYRAERAATLERRRLIAELIREEAFQMESWAAGRGDAYPSPTFKPRRCRCGHRIPGEGCEGVGGSTPSVEPPPPSPPRAQAPALRLD